MVEVIVDRLVKRRLQAFHVVRVKADSVGQAEYAAKEDFIVGVVADVQPLRREDMRHQRPRIHGNVRSATARW